MEGQFPVGCAYWAEAHGCTRVEIKSAGCVRPQNIDDENSVVFYPSNPQSLMSNAIAACITQVPGAKIMYPINLD